MDEKYKEILLKTALQRLHSDIRQRECLNCKESVCKTCVFYEMLKLDASSLTQDWLSRGVYDEVWNRILGL